MTIKDIIGTVIRTSPYSVYTVVEGLDWGHFALKPYTGETNYDWVYNIECYNDHIKRGTWKVITEPCHKPQHKQMEKQYITVKDLPDIAVGSISYKEAQYNYYFKGKNRDQVAYLKEIVETSDFFREYIAPFNAKCGDYLYCHTSLVMKGGGKEEATKGKVYKCEANGSFIDNSGDKHGLIGCTHEWFRLATEEEIKTYKETKKKEVKIVIGKPSTEVTIGKDGWITGRVEGTPFSASVDSILEILTYFQTVTFYIAGYIPSIKEATLHIGCDSGIDVTLADLTKIAETYKRM